MTHPDMIYLFLHCRVESDRGVNHFSLMSISGVLSFSRDARSYSETPWFLLMIPGHYRMKKSDNSGTPSRLVVADMDGGQAIDLPGIRGRMERLEFASGMVLYRMEYEALDDCHVQVQNSFSEPWIGSAMHLQGHSELRHPNGNTFSLTNDSALLMRVDPSGSLFRLFKGQLIRHVGVASTITPLLERFGGTLPEKLALFRDGSFGEVQIGQSFSPSNRLRTCLITTPAAAPAC